MQMTLLPITVWLTHFLTASAFNFNTLPTHTLNDHIQTITPATPSLPMTTTTQENTTNLPTQVHVQPNTTPSLETTSQDDTMDGDVSISTASHAAMSGTNTGQTTASTNFVNNETMLTESYNDDGHSFHPNVASTQETTSLDQSDSSSTQNDMMNGDVSISNASDASYTKTRQTTAFTNLTRLNNETGTMSYVSPNDDGHTFQPNTIPNVGSTQETTSLDQFNSNLSQNDTMNGDVSTSNASVTNLTRLLLQRDENNETATMSNVSSNDDGRTYTIPNVASTQETTFLHQFMDGDDYTNTSSTPVSTNFTRLTPLKDENNETGTMSTASYNDFQTADPFSNVSTVTWKDWTEKEDEATKDDEGNYETNPTQDTFANMSEQSRGTEGSYNFTNEHREEHYNTINVQTDWSTSQNTDIPMTTPLYTISQDPAVTDEPEYRTSTGGVNHSTTLQDLFRFTHTESENMTGTDTPVGTTNNNNNNSTLTVNSTNSTTNKTDVESEVWPTCLNSSQKSRLVCFITVWTLAMTATIFLGITIFLWVRLSIVKERIKRKEKGGHVSEKENLWADPKASVQERVEFWYINGSTLEADRKEKNKKRQERLKRKGQEQVNEENGLWIQPKVTVDDITEFWYANRRLREERMQNMGF